MPFWISSPLKTSKLGFFDMPDPKGGDLGSFCSIDTVLQCAHNQRKSVGI
jgi:hypothetical protein